MGALLILIGFVALIAVLVSVVREAVAWLRLDAATKARLRSFGRADRAVRIAERDYRRRVTEAEQSVIQATNPPLLRAFGGLQLFDDRVRLRGQEFALTPKTKARVVARGAGEERRVMLQLEDVSWPRAVDATEKGVSDFAAQRFVADVRVLGPKAAAARAYRAESAARARQVADAVSADTSGVEAARQAREQLGARPTSDRHHWRRATAAAGFVVMLVGGAISPQPPTDSPGTSLADAATDTPVATPEPTPAGPTRSELMRAAQHLIQDGEYAKAQVTVAQLSPATRSLVRRQAADRASRVAQHALQRGDLRSARRALDKAHGLPRTADLQLAWDDYHAAVDTARSEAESRAAEAAASQAVDDTASGSYAGQTCAEIGHSFQVTPGSDPEHDADGDGVACESQ